MPAHVFDFTGKTVLITGGSRGLGRAMALGFAQAGADIAIASRKLEACEQTAREIEALGRQAFAHACHVGYWEQCDALGEAVYARFGRIDVLINNAGMSPVYSSPAEITEALYDKVMDVNLKGPFRLCALVGQRMVRDGGGAIVNISSMAAVRPSKNVITYAAAKAGLNAMTEAFADAYGPKVRVNGIMPGPFLTDIAKAWDMDAFARRAEHTIRFSAAASRKKSSALRCTSRPIRPATRPALSCESMAAQACAAGTIDGTCGVCVYRVNPAQPKRPVT